MRFIKATADPECNLLVGQCSTEMLLDVGLQHCVEVLELSVGDQANDVYLEDARERKTQMQLHAQLQTFTGWMKSQVLSSDRHVYLEGDGQADTEDVRHDSHRDMPSKKKNQPHLLTKHAHLDTQVFVG